MATHQCPVEILQARDAIECIIRYWDCRAPDDEDDPQMIELISEAMHLAGVMGKDVETKRSSVLTWGTNKFMAFLPRR